LLCCKIDTTPVLLYSDKFGMNPHTHPEGNRTPVARSIELEHTSREQIEA
jgi:hypothetical protein